MKSDDLMAQIRQRFQEIASAHVDDEEPMRLVPSVPNTQTFRAAVSGMIQMERHVATYTYGMPLKFDTFLKVGGGVRAAVKREIRAEVEQALADLGFPAGIPASLKCDDGRTVSVSVTDGTNWGGFGVSV